MIMRREGMLRPPGIVYETPEETYNTADQFLGREFSRSQDKLFGWWQERFARDPLSFFTPQNLEKLKDVPPADRLYFLMLASRELVTTPKHVRDYAAIYPDDARTLGVMFDEQGGRAGSTFEHNLYSVAMPLIEAASPDAADLRGFNQYREIAVRRELAPRALMRDARHYEDLKKLEAFGAAAHGILSAFDEAEELKKYGNHLIDPQKMFTAELIALPSKKQAELLRLAVAEIQRRFVFHETFNSAFTKERVEEDRRHYSEPATRNTLHHNVAHSIIFRTYQPVSVFDLQQSHFQREMDSTADIGGYLEEYPYHRLFLAILERLQTINVDATATVDTVLEFWDKNRDPIFGNAVTELLSAKDPNYAAAQLMKLLRAEKENKNPLAAILYRLEFGHIGVSDEGVRYLERQYDLDEYNRGDYHVQRLTADGEMGIFDEERALIKYFHLGDLSSPEQKVRAAVLDFTYDTLFLPPENETEAERQKRLAYLEQFKKHYNQIANDRMFAQTGVRLNNLSFHEQGWFVIHFNEADEKRQDRLRQFVGQHRELGLKTFFSLEYGEELGDAILTISEHLSPATAEAVFRKYGEIAAAATSLEPYLAKKFGLDPERHRKQILDVTHGLLRRGKKLLEQVAAEAAAGVIRHEVDLAPRLAALTAIKTDILLFANAFHVATETTGLELTDVVGVELTSKDSSQLTPGDKEVMTATFIANRRANPEAYPPALLEKLTEEFSERLNNPGTQYYLLCDEDRPVAFMHFEPGRDGRKYAGSLNVEPEGRGHKIGSAFFQVALEREGRDSEIEAIVNTKNPMLKHYIDDFDFEIVSHETKKGVDYVWIVRPPGGRKKKSGITRQAA